MRQTFLIPDQSLIQVLREQYEVEHTGPEVDRFAVGVSDDWDGQMLELSAGRMAVVAGSQLVYAWEMDHALVHFLELLGWVAGSPLFEDEHPRYILNPLLFTTRSDGRVALSHVLGKVFVPQDGRLVETQLEESEQGKVTEPDERAKIHKEVRRNVQFWQNLSNVPFGDTYDASEVVERIVCGFELLGDTEAANIYRAMIEREKTHNWVDEDDPGGVKKVGGSKTVGRTKARSLFLICISQAFPWSFTSWWVSLPIGQVLACLCCA